MYAKAGVLALVASNGLVAAAPTFGWWPFGNSGGYGSGNGGYGSPAPSYGYTPPAYTPPAYTPPAYTPPKTITTPKYTPPAYTPPAYTPPVKTTPKYTPPSYTPPAYTPPAYTPPSYTPPSYTPPSGGYGGGNGGLNPIGWLGGIIGGLTGSIGKIFDITLFFGKKFEIEITLEDKTVIKKQVSYLGSTELGELKVEHILVADVELNLGFLTCEFKFKEDVEIDAIFGITSGFSHTYGKGNYGKYGSSDVSAGVKAGATIKWLTVIGIDCNISPPKGYGFPPGYTPPKGGKPYSYTPPTKGYGY